MYELCYPNYDFSIVNLISSILKKYGAKSNHKSLPFLDKELSKSQTKVVLFIVDGFGVEILKKHTTAESIFQKKLKDEITTVFPSTTTAAISSFLSGLTPLEHGLIGWSLYFQEYFRLIDFLPCWQSEDSSKLDENTYKIFEKMKFESIFSKINNVQSGMNLVHITKKEIMDSGYTKMSTEGAVRRGYENVESCFELLREELSRPVESFITCYMSDPDAIMHKEGVSSENVTKFLKIIEREITEIQADFKDMLFIITADHGLVDNPCYIDSRQDETLYDAMILPAFPEPRFSSLFIKEDQKNKFEAWATAHQDQFLCFKKEVFLEKEVLGRGTMHPRLISVLGNYLLIGKGETGMMTTYDHIEPRKPLIAHHAGLTREEMVVPVIIL